MRYVEINPGEVLVKDGDPPDAPPGWARVRVDACAVCGSDVHMLEGMDLPPGVTYPMRPGHEVAGTVLSLEPGARAGAPVDVRVGDRVVLHPLAPCGTCEACLRGREQRCARARILGFTDAGGLADEVVWPAERLVAVNDIPPVVAALLPDAVATAYHALETAALPPGGSLVLLGAGGVGTHLLHLAKVVDPTATLLAVVRSESTAERVRALGVECVVGLDGAARTVRDRLGEVDAVVDFSGATASPGTGIRMLRRGGRLVLGSIVDEPVQLGVNTTTVVMREIQIVGSYASTIHDLREVARLTAEGKLDLQQSASLRMPLERAAEAIHTVRDRPAGHVRLVLQP